MYIARILFPVKVLGPGKRIGIWFNGCHHACKGCCNPELWEFQEKYKISIEDLIKLIYFIREKNKIDGFTITGGEPFEQPEALCCLLNEISKISSDIIVYTGYEYDLLKDKYPNIIDKICVLIDGKYIEEKNDNCFMKGSSNQNIIILNTELQCNYEKYFETGKNEIQNFPVNGGAISVGIHKVGFNEELNKRLYAMGLEDLNNE